MPESGETAVRCQPPGSQPVLPIPPSEKDPLPVFTGGGDFQAALRRRADQYFQRTGKRPRGSLHMYGKAAFFLAGFGACYALLLFASATWWLALAFSVALGLCMAGIGFNVMHDALHGAFSRYPWVNRAMGLSLDLIGGSSYFWRLKHNVIHHTYTNISPVDTSIALGPIGRVSPVDPWRPAHRWQHWYLWPLYGLTAIKWHLFDDFRELTTGRVGGHASPRPRRWELAGFVAGKATFLALAFGVPLALHSWWAVALFYLVVTFSLSFPLSIVTQVAHCAEPAQFWTPALPGTRMERLWAVHQVESSVDFARGNSAAAWLLGGLNFQIEHHLFPRVSHIHYPALSRIVEDTCREFGVRYFAYPSVTASVVAHHRWLRKLGQPGPAA